MFARAKTKEQFNPTLDYICDFTHNTLFLTQMPYVLKLTGELARTLTTVYSVFVESGKIPMKVPLKQLLRSRQFILSVCSLAMLMAAISVSSSAPELAGACLFITFVLIVALWCVVSVLVIVAEFITRKQLAQLHVMDKIMFCAGVAGFFCIVYGYVVEPYWPEITYVKIATKKLTGSKDKFRIVHISDVHSDPRARLEERLPPEIAALKPDIIGFSGDSINSPEGLPVFRKFISQLAKIAPTFVVKGNWDAWYFKDKDRFGGTGAIELDGTAQTVRIGSGDQTINVQMCGLPVGTKKTVHEVMQGVPEKDFRVFLFHYPDFIEEMDRSKVDLYLAGHTHGGQVALPIYGAIVTLSARGKQFESGLHKYGNTQLYVSRGIGMEGGMAPRVRFCARPEVTVIDVSGQSP